MDLDISSEAEFPADLVEALSGTHKFVSKIGAGAMGSVYRTRNILLERDEALKIISGNISPERLKRLRLEAQSLGKAAGIGIAAVYNIAVTKSGRPYILMEYLPGVSLRQVIKESFPLNPDLVALWMHQICFGIDQAHKMGIIHRDIKPDNILISKAAAGWEDAKVIDFGISRITDVQHELTLGNVSLGTPLYMSPEQFVDGAELTYKADIYSLGCVLYEMLTGHPPFEASTALELIGKHLNEEPAKLPANLRHFQPVLKKAMAKNPDDRHAGALEIWGELYVSIWGSNLWGTWSRPAILIPISSGDNFLKSRKAPEKLLNQVRLFWLLSALTAVTLLAALLACVPSYPAIASVLSSLPKSAYILALVSLAFLALWVLHMIRVRLAYPRQRWWQEPPSTLTDAKVPTAPQ